MFFWSSLVFSMILDMIWSRMLQMPLNFEDCLEPLARMGWLWVEDLGVGTFGTACPGVHALAELPSLLGLEGPEGVWGCPTNTNTWLVLIPGPGRTPTRVQSCTHQCTCSPDTCLLMFSGSREGLEPRNAFRKIKGKMDLSTVLPLGP